MAENGVHTSPLFFLAEGLIYLSINNMQTGLYMLETVETVSPGQQASPHWVETRC